MDSRRTSSLTFGVPVCKIGIAAGVFAATTTLLAPAPARADTGDQSYAFGQFLGGSALTMLDLDAVAEVHGQRAGSDGTADDGPYSNALNPELLGTLDLNLGGALGALPLDIGTGLIGQYAFAGKDGYSEGFSGLVSDAGAIGTPNTDAAAGAMTLQLGDLLDQLGLGAVATQVADMSLTLEDLAASLEQDGGAAPVGDYQIGAASLALDSPALAGVGTAVLDLLAGDLTETIDDALIVPILVPDSAIEVSLALDASGIGGIGDLAQDGFTLNLFTGEITLDLAALAEGDINDLAPNSLLLTGANLASLTDDITVALTEYLTNTLAGEIPQIGVSGVVSAALLGVDVASIGGTLGDLDVALLPGLPAPVTALLGLIGDVVSIVTNTVAGALGGLGDLVGDSQGVLLAPLLTTLLDNTTGNGTGLADIIAAALQLTVNVQEFATDSDGNPGTPADFGDPGFDTTVQGGYYTQRALSLQLLPLSGTANVAAVELANAVVGLNVHGAPVGLSIDPAAGPESGGDSVTITGGNLAGVTELTICGQTIAVTPSVGAPDVADDDTITFVTPPCPVAADTAVPIDLDGDGDATNDIEFTYLDLAGSVATIEPDAGPESGGDPSDPADDVTITGTCFAGATGVQFGTAPDAVVVLAADFVSITDTEIVLDAPPYPVDADTTVAVTVLGTTFCDDLVAGDGYTYLAAPDNLALDPDRGSEAGGETVIISGDDLDTTTGVTVDGVAYAEADGPEAPLPGEYVVHDDGTVTIVTLPHAPGPVDVVVTNDGGASDPIEFTYEPAPPTILLISPDQGPESGGTWVTISGTQLDTTDAVSVDGVGYTGALDPGNPVPGEYVVNPDGTLTVVTLPHTPAAVAIVVSNEAGDDSGVFTYVAQTMNVISIDPDAGPETGGTQIVITGGPFGDADIVHVGAVEVPVTPAMLANHEDLDPTNDTITFPAPAHPAGVVQIYVEITDDDLGVPGTVGISDSEPFEYTPVAAYGLALDPDNGPAAGGNTVVISGSELDTAVAVTVDTDVYTLAPNPANPQPGEFVVNPDGTLGVVMLAHLPGTVDVVVTNDAGDSTEPLGYTYRPGTIGGIDPDSGPETGGDPDDEGTWVTITGECFTGADDVLFGGVPALEFTVVSDTEIVAVPPPGAPGTVDVTVVGTELCGDIVGVDAYTYVPAGVTTTSLSPDHGPESGGTSVVISGSGFTSPDVTGVTFGGVPATDVTIIDDQTIVAIAPPHAAGVVGVVVQSPAGDSAPLPYTYEPLAPSVAGIAPASGPETGGTVVTITGSGFTGPDVTEVTFDGVPGTDLVIVSDTEIRITSPAHAPGAVDVIVTSPAGASAPATYTYTDVIDGPPEGEPPLDASRFVPVTPCRLLDTRETGTPKPLADSTRTLQVAGQCNVPEDAISATMTLTVTLTDDRGHLTAWPGGAQPVASNLNYGPHENRSNSTVVRLADDGSLQLYTYASTHLVVDVTGYWIRSSGGTTSGRFVADAPQRLLDTRLSGQSPFGPFEQRVVPLPAGVPSDATALAINVTMDQTLGASWFAAFPANLTERPLVSAVNSDGTDQIRAGSLIVPVSPEGFKLVGKLGGHVVVDYLGYFTGESAAMSTTGLFVPQAPGRVVDTRQGAGGPIAGQSSIDVGTGVPGSGVIVNLTMVQPAAPNWLRAWEKGAAMPATSSVNATSEPAVANLAIIGQSDGQQLSIFSKVNSHVVVDVAGWFYE